MKVTATRDVYTYDELTPDAQRNALTHLCADAWQLSDEPHPSEWGQA